MAKHTWLAAIFLCSVWIPIEALAQGAPPDIVELENGGLVRGTIVESIPGDHVTIQLVTGETRTFPAVEVRYAGPTRAAAEATPVPPPSYQPAGPAPAVPGGPRTVRVHVEGAPGLTLQRVTGTGSAIVSSGYGVAAISIDTFAPVCIAPCDADLEVATYRFGVSAGQGNAQLAGHNTFSLDRDTTLRLEYDDRTGLRILGWSLFISGTLGGMLGGLAPTFATRFDDGVPFLVLGSVLGGSMMIAGFVFIFLRDHVDIQQGAIRF